jgi:DNA polymerase-2
MTQQTIDGFLLTREWFDRGQMHLQFWLTTDQGAVRVDFDNQDAVLFVESKQIEKAREVLVKHVSRMQENEFPKGRWYDKALPLKNFQNEAVHAVYFKEQRWLYRARDLLKQAGITPFEADVNPADRFLMERFITGSLNVQGELIEEQVVRYLNNPKLKQGNYLPSYKVLSLDIETSMRGELLYSIALLLGHTHDKSVCERKVFMIGPIQENGQDHLPDYLEYCVDETDLMTQFLEYFQYLDSDIVIGWAVINFDLRFLQRKADQLNIALSLGRNNAALDWRQSRDNDEHYTLLMPGRLVLDGIETLKSATYNFESFSLQNVSNELLKRGKLIHNVDNRGEEITEQFHNDKLSLAAYNLEDCQLVWDIFKLTELIDFAVERAQLTGLAMDRFGGSVASFDNRYLPRLHRAGFIAPNLQDEPEGIGSPGGYVMNSRPDMYDHVLVLDFKSLYPSIIRTFKIDPLALMLGLQQSPHQAVRDQQETKDVNLKELIPGFNGAVFSKTENILPAIIDELWAARDLAKKHNNKPMSQAIKILMNSFYGVLGTPGCRFFDYRLPSSITLRGHEILNKSKYLIEEKGYQVIYGDTDSIFVWLEGMPLNTPATEINTLGNNLAEELNVWWKDHLEKQFDLDSGLEIEFETHFKRFVMPTIRGSERGSKKRYAGLVETIRADENGKEKNELSLVFKGLETVRTDWTAVAREFQRELYRRIFYNEPWKEYIQQIVDEIHSGKRDEQLVYRKRIRRRLDDYTKNIPPQIQAARIADIKRLAEGKAQAYQRGGWIQYVWTLNGPEPAEYISSQLDYDLYIERQIEPIADGILQFLGTNFKEVAGQQLGMF